MQRSATTTLPGVADADLAELAAAPGPFLSLAMPTEPAIDNAAQRSLAEWKTLRDGLTAAGADDRCLQVVDEVVADAHLHGPAVAVVASAGGVRHVEYGPRWPRPLARWAPLPTVVPLLRWRQDVPPHVAVLVDRTGADLIAVDRANPPRRQQAGGDDWPIHKAHAGGWSTRRHQLRVEGTWEHNARDVAARIEEVVSTVDARVVLVAGDERALSLVRQHLPRWVGELVRAVPGSRAADGSGDTSGDAVARLVHSAVAEDTVEVLERFHEERGRGDRAADGIDATLDAVRRGQVDLLLLHDDPDDRRRVWFGGRPELVAADPEDLRGLGEPQPQQGRLADALVRAVLGSGGRVRLVPAHGGPTDGVGAVLRWGPGRQADGASAR